MKSRGILRRKYVGSMTFIITFLDRALYQLGFVWKQGTPDMGLSENSVPLHPMVNDHYPY